MKAWHYVTVAGAACFAVASLRWCVTERRRFRRPNDPHFSNDYAEARDKFRALASALGAEQKAYVIGQDSSKGVELTIDTALVRRNPKRYLVHLSGVHGVEGFAGSAIQCAALQRLAAKPLDDDAPSVLFVHAVNPFGFHFLRRFNEQNVDLNRNFLLSEERWDTVHARTPNQFHYEDISCFLNPGRPLKWYEWYPTVLYNLFRVRRFFKFIRKAVVTGQYHAPNGLYYGGKGLERSNAILRDVLSETLQTADIAMCIDVHSGLGVSGEDTLMANHSLDALRAYFPTLRFSGPDTDAVSAGYEDQMGGTTLDGVVPAGCVGLHVTQEFGTIPPAQVLWAMIVENAAYSTCPLWAEERYWAAKHLRDAFYVPTDTWRAKVLERGASLFNLAIARLATA